jgi:hypothetical protein
VKQLARLWYGRKLLDFEGLILKDPLRRCCKVMRSIADPSVPRCTKQTCPTVVPTALRI